MAVFRAFFGLFMAGVVTGQIVNIEPKEAVVRVGGEVSVLCKVPYSIDSCRMSVNHISYILVPGSTTGDVIYNGTGLKAGECGAIIRNIKEEWNGEVKCMVPPKDGNIEVEGVMRLTVARPPGEPTLLTPPQPWFTENSEFMAQCVVPNGRPAARISWFLDDEQLLRGIHQPIIDTDASGMATIRQNLTMALTADEDRKTVVCRAEHEALLQPREVKRQLVVQYPPKRMESGAITIFGLKLGGEGRLNVTVRANPAPRVEWRVGDMTLAPLQSNDVGSIMALEPAHLGGGYFNVSLLIAHIAKEDVERKYYLKVWNDLGDQEFVLTISTMDEPVGVELDTGAIVGIVVAVLALLIAVFLVVFAKATGRWCFAGRADRVPDGHRGRDHAKSSGESDTESAVGGRERSRLAQLSARVRGVLPRAKDKVQATEAPQPAPEQKPLSDDKKGVVYAELQLGEQTAEKPPPPSTEYAEIVYTDQPKENME